MLYLLRKTWKYAAEERYKLVLCYVLHVLSISGKLIQPFAFGMVINRLQEDGLEDLDGVYRWLGVYVIGFFCYQIFHHTGRYFEVTCALGNQRRFNMHAYEKLYHLPMKWHREHHSGDVINRVKTGGEAIKAFSFRQSTYMDLILSSVVPIVVFVRINGMISVITVVLMAVNLYVVTKMNLRIEKIMKDIHERYHLLAARLADYIGNIMTILTLGLGRKTREALDDMHLSYQKEQMREFRINQPRCFIIAFGAILTEIIVVLYYVLWHKGTGEIFLIGNLVMVITYFRSMSDSIFELLNVFYDTMNWKAAMKSTSIFDNLSMKDKVVQYTGAWNSIRIEHLAFRYPGAVASTVWKYIELERGNRIALVGTSGSGKSTLLHLLASLEEPMEIDMAVGGHKVSSLQVMKDQIGLVRQDSEIFDDTIAHNITFGLEGDRARLHKALDMAALGDMMNALSEGVNTPIKEKGVNLSGGQKQRVALARGLYFAMDKGILLLDEITSSMDAANEVSIMKGIMAGCRDACIVSSIHRLHLLELFDEIWVMKEGYIVQRGSLSQLIEQEGEFLRLWQDYQLNQG